MPVHGAQPYIAEAIDSVFEQTFSDCELIIVSEPDTEMGVLTTIDGYVDNRIVHHKNEERLGLVRSLNLAMELAKGEYLARLDSDDKWARTKLERQCQYLDEHPEIAVIGSSSYAIDEKSEIIGEKHSITDPTVIGWRLLYDDVINNTSSIMRTIVPRAIGGYDPKFNTAEDYDFWVRASETFKLGNLPEKLVFYRINPIGISTVNLGSTNANAAVISQRSMEKTLGTELSPEVVRTMRFPYEVASSWAYEQAARTTIEMCHKYVGKRSLDAEESKKIFDIASRAYWDLLARAASVDVANSWSVIARAILSRPPRPSMETIKQASIAFGLGLKTRRTKHKEGL
jgi:hypothetical protein